MRALYEIDQELLDCVDMETGEILDVERLDALQMERERKLEGVALWIKDLNYEATAVKEEADKLTARKKALDNKITGLKQWLLYTLNGEKMKTPRCNVYQTHNQKLTVVNETALVSGVSQFHSGFLAFLQHQKINALLDLALATNLGEHTLHLWGATDTTRVFSIFTVDSIFLHHKLLAVALHSELKCGLQLLDRLVKALHLW